MAQGFVTLPGTDEYVKQTPGLSIAEFDIELIMYVEMTDWTPTANEVLIAKWSGTTTLRQFIVLNLTTNQVQCQVQDTGLGQEIYNHSATWTNGVGRWIRWVWTASNGSAVASSRLYTSTEPINIDVDDITWTEVGTEQSSAFEADGLEWSATENVLVGARQSSTVITDFADMKVYYWSLDGDVSHVGGDYRFDQSQTFVGTPPTRPDDFRASTEHELTGTAPTYTPNDSVLYKARRFGTTVDLAAGKSLTMLMREDG